MKLSLILVAAVWCVFARAESASVEDQNNLKNVPLIGGSPVDTDSPQPYMADILIHTEKQLLKTCEALLVKHNEQLAYGTS